MPKQYFLTNDPSKKIAYDINFFRDTHAGRFWDKLMSEKGDNVIYLTKELKGKKGDQVQFQNFQTLDENQTIKDGQNMNGRLQILGKDEDSVYLTTEGCGVEYYGGLSAQRVLFEMDDVTKERLKSLATALQDKVIFDALYATPFTKQFYGKDTPVTTSNLAALTAADKLTISKIKYVATGMKNGWNRSQEPVEPFIDPATKKPYYMILMHDDILYDFKEDPRYEAWVREAAEKGKSNPLFTGALLAIDGHAIYSHERAYIAKNGGGTGVNLPVGQVTFFGKNALAYAEGPAPSISMETFQHRKKVEYYWELMYGCKHLQFKNKQGTKKDRGCVSMMVARTSISDAE